MRRLAFLLGVMVISGLLVSTAYAGGKVAGLNQTGMVVKAAPAKVQVAKESFVDAVKAYFSIHFGGSIIKDRSKEPSKPNEPRKDWGYRPGVGEEYIIIRDNGGIEVDK